MLHDLTANLFAMQAGGFVQVQDRFRNAYQEVKTTMAQLYSFFQTDSEEVQREWLKFTHKVHHFVTLQHAHFPVSRVFNVVSMSGHSLACQHVLTMSVLHKSGCHLCIHLYFLALHFA